MRFDEDILEAVRANALLRFWGREVSTEVAKATHGSSQAGGSLLAMLGVDVTQEDTQAVADQLIASGFSDFLSRAPGIEPYFRRRKESIHRYLEEVVANVNAHEEQIAQELLGGKRPTRVLSMSQASFTYRGARSVLVIATDAGKFLYKPHPMHYSTVFSELCENLLPRKVHVPRVVDCGGACLCEFIESMPPKNEEERNGYYEGLGGYLALASFLSLTDQHADNVLPVGSKFAPIDVETLLLASPAIKGGAPEPNDPSLGIRGSIASTAMLCYSHDRLVGSLVAGTKGKGITSMGTSTEAIDHLEAMEKGFAEAFRRCLQNKQAICNAIRSLADVDLRILMAPGSFYQGLQARFFKLEGWDEASRLQDLDRILRSSRFKRADESVFAHERAVLVEHDIPYFTVKAGGVDLLAEGEVAWPDYLAESPVETAIRHVEEADEVDLGWQLQLLRKLVRGMPLMSKTRVPDIQPQRGPLAKDEAAEEAGWILSQLFDEQVDCGQAGHAIMAFGNAAGNYGPMDASLAWGYAGVGIFAAACLRCAVGDQGQARELMDMCLGELARNGRYLEMCPEALSTEDVLGLKTGLAGHLRALQLMWSATRDYKICQIYTDLLALLDAVDFSSVSSPTALVELTKVLAHAVPGLPSCACCESIASELPSDAAGDRNNISTCPAVLKASATSPDALPLQNRDDLHRGNAGVVERLITSGQLESAGKHLAAMVARRHETGNYIHKGAWRVPYFDPTLFYGATGVGYELLRYAFPDKVEPLFL